MVIKGRYQISLSTIIIILISGLLEVLKIKPFISLVSFINPLVLINLKSSEIIAYNLIIFLNKKSL